MMFLDLVGNMKAKKSLGQNFLKEDTIINKIVSLLNVKEKDLIIEIGPGKGALTKKLVNLSAKLICVEIDKDMHPFLDNLNCQIIYEDILSLDLKSLANFKQYENIYVIGNLPYYITTPIMQKLIESNINIKEMIFMVQKEVAQRFTAKAGVSEYGYMSLYLNYYYDVFYEFTVESKYFLPEPKVDSAIIKLIKKHKRYNIDEKKYFSFLKEAFALKRKTLKNNLKNYDWNKIVPILKAHNLDVNVRAEEISQEIFIEIFLALY